MTQNSSKPLLFPTFPLSRSLILPAAPIPDTLTCPCCSELLQDPVIDKQGHTFCRNCTCAICKDTQRNEVFNNSIVAKQVNALLVHCVFGTKMTDDKTVCVDEQGCPELIPLGRTEEHAKQCSFSWHTCPNSYECPPLRSEQVQTHLLSCKHFHCTHANFGCQFEGTQEQTKKHLNTCRFEEMSDFFKSYTSQMNSLNQSTDLLRKEYEHNITQMNSFAGKVEEALGVLETRIARTESGFQQLMSMIEALNLRQSQILKSVQDSKSVAEESGPMHDHVLSCQGTFSGHTGPVWALAIADNQLISASSDELIKVWDVHDQKNIRCVQTLVGHSGIVHAIAVLGRKLFSASADTTIKVWNLDNGECEHTIQAHDNVVCSVVIGNGYLFSGSYQHVKVFDIETYEVVAVLGNHNHWVRAITVANGYLYTGTHNILKCWDLGNFMCSMTIQLQARGSIYSIATSGKYLFAGTYGHIIEVWNLETQKFERQLEGHNGAVYCLKAHSNKLFSGSYDCTIKVWNLDTMQNTQTLWRHTSSVDALAVHGNTLFSGSTDTTIKIWK